MVTVSLASSFPGKVSSCFTKNRQAGISVTWMPAWRFLVKQELAFSGKEDASETVTMEQASYVFFNAATGQEIVTDLGGI